MPKTHYYLTGMCFWDYLESTYGHQTFQRVMQALAARRGETACIPFLKDIVNPIVGTDISVVTNRALALAFRIPSAISKESLDMNTRPQRTPSVLLACDPSSLAGGGAKATLGSVRERRMH